MMILDHNKKLTAALAAFSGGRMPHALLFEGPAGTGKKTASSLVAQLALCEGGQPPCGVCAHCIKVEKQIHPDVRFFTVPEGKKEFPVDLVRELRQEASILPNEGRCKVYILDKAHAMNAAAQNALLKLIEEPPTFVRFVLLCESRSMMLPTILSRVTSFTLETPSPDACAATLARLAPDVDETLRKAAAAGAGGNVGRALALLGEAKPSKAAADARVLCKTMLDGDRYQSLKLLTGYDKDREGLSQLFILLKEDFAQLALARWQPQTAQDAAAPRLTPGQAANAMRAVDTAATRAGRNVGIPLLCACLVEEMRAALTGD